MQAQVAGCFKYKAVYHQVRFFQFFFCWTSCVGQQRLSRRVRVGVRWQTACSSQPLVFLREGNEEYDSMCSDGSVLSPFLERASAMTCSGRVGRGEGQRRQDNQKVPSSQTFYQWFIIAMIHVTASGLE
ncbi:hypothetical protein LIA77_09396 [Sarocladium implicatum]|nr:hypothetical protein LIA77_09396 [Sarocladium implicatum]